MKISNQDLYNINKNEYHTQQESTLKDAIEMGLTEDEFNLICNKIKKIPNKTELGIFRLCFQNIVPTKVQKNGLKPCLLKQST